MDAPAKPPRVERAIRLHTPCSPNFEKGRCLRDLLQLCFGLALNVDDHALLPNGSIAHSFHQRLSVRLLRPLDLMLCNAFRSDRPLGSTKPIRMEPLFTGLLDRRLAF